MPNLKKWSGLFSILVTEILNLRDCSQLLEGTQDATVYMDLKSMAYTAVNEAYNMATKKKPNVNSEFDNESKFKIDAFLINGKLITRENIDRVLIAPGHFTHEQIYGN